MHAAQPQTRIARIALGVMLAAMLVAHAPSVRAASGDEQLAFVRQANAMLQSGKQSVRAGDPEGAIRQFRGLRQWAHAQPHLEWYPMTYEPMAQHYVADTLTEAGRHDEAIAEARTGLAV